MPTTTSDQVLYGDAAKAGTYECVDCGRRIELADPVDAMSPCEADDGHHKTRAWQPVDPSQPPREVTGEAPPNVPK